MGEVGGRVASATRDGGGGGEEMRDEVKEKKGGVCSVEVWIRVSFLSRFFRSRLVCHV